MVNAGILYALLGMTMYGLSDVFAKLLINRFSRHMIMVARGALMIPALIIIASGSFPIQLSWLLLFTIVLSIAGFFPFYFYLSAVKKGNLSIVAPIAKSAIIITVLLSMLLLKERLNTAQAILICFIIIGVMLLSMNIRALMAMRMKMHSGVLPALAAALMWGVVYVAWKFPVQAYGPWFSAFMIETGVVVAALALVRKEDIRVLQKIDRRICLIILAGAATTLLGTVGYMKAISMAPLSLVMPIVTATPVVSTLVAVTYFKERLSAMQWLGGVLVVGGIGMLFVV